eukprot:SAG31_NODE_135_length_23206_cov_25.707967_25_plen_70_part_00
MQHDDNFWLFSWEDTQYWTTITFVLLWCFGWAYAAMMMMARTTLQRHQTHQNAKREISRMRGAMHRKQQ